jgi:hypothetical protein
MTTAWSMVNVEETQHGGQLNMWIFTRRQQKRAVAGAVHGGAAGHQILGLANDGSIRHKSGSTQALHMWLVWLVRSAECMEVVSFGQ